MNRAKVIAEDLINVLENTHGIDHVRHRIESVQELVHIIEQLYKNLRFSEEVSHLKGVERNQLQEENESLKNQLQLSRLLNEHLNKKFKELEEQNSTN